MAKKKQDLLQTDLNKAWKHWPYKNTTLLALSLVAFLYLARTPEVESFIKSIGNLGYLGAFITGIFFVSTFTVAPAAIVLFNLADHLHPVEVALLAGLGAMIGDYIIFRFLKDRVFDELVPLLRKMRLPKLRTLYKSPYFSWTLPFIGAAIIASPMPDEVGIGMLGMSKIRPWQFFLVTFVLNALGIFVVVTSARLVS